MTPGATRDEVKKCLQKDGNFEKSKSCDGEELFCTSVNQKSGREENTTVIYLDEEMKMDTMNVPEPVVNQVTILGDKIPVFNVKKLDEESKILPNDVANYVQNIYSSIRNQFSAAYSTSVSFRPISQEDLKKWSHFPIAFSQLILTALQFDSLIFNIAKSAKLPDMSKMDFFAKKEKKTLMAHLVNNGVNEVSIRKAFGFYEATMDCTPWV